MRIKSNFHKYDGGLIMADTHKPPTTVAEAIKMVIALNPDFEDVYSDYEKKQAFNRLIDFFKLLLPDT